MFSHSFTHPYSTTFHQIVNTFNIYIATQPEQTVSVEMEYSDCQGRHLFEIVLNTIYCGKI